jgi:Cu2+-exporting ATPase
MFAAENVENRPGFGVVGTCKNIRYALGNARLTPDIETPSLNRSLPPGSTVVWLSDTRRILAAFVLADTLRPQAGNLVKALQNGGASVSILSGDAPDTVAYFAEKLGVNDWRAGLTPEGKLAALKEWQNNGEIVSMIGDGINDAPVLAGAPVSIAMGGGTQMARASGDVVLLSENLLEIDHARITSRFGMNVVRQNFLWALAYNLIALPFAASGHLSPWLAALGMSVSSLVVVLNALRLR